MKTSEEIKRGLKLCSHEGHGEEIICEHCPYDSNSCAVLICTRRLSADALAYIQQLETENHQLLTKAQQLESTAYKSTAVGINYQSSKQSLVWQGKSDPERAFTGRGSTKNSSPQVDQRGGEVAGRL